jgi:bacterioferritin
MSDARTQQIIDELVVAYWAEIETVQNYLANSSNLDGVRAEEIKKSLAADITEEIGHAQQLAGRIRVLGGTVPGSKQFKATQDTLQPPADSTDVVSVIKGVMDAEEGAIAQYR